PATIAATPLANPGTSIGERRRVVVPSPSCPYVLSPQHLAPPPGVTAQVWPSPGAITLAVRPGTSTGVRRWVVVPSPSWPLVLLPQHFTPPPALIAQVWLPPPAASWAIPPSGTNALADPEAHARTATSAPSASLGRARRRPMSCAEGFKQPSWTGNVTTAAYDPSPISA